jgi:hypothetical protein
MNTRNVVLAISGMLTVAGLSLAIDASADSQPLQPTPPLAQIAPSPLGPYAAKALTCSNPGSQQDVAKEPILKNTTGATLAKGSTIYWFTKPAQGAPEKGRVELENALAPGGTVQGHGNPGQVYTCGGFIVQ